MHGRHAVTIVLALVLLPLSGCIGVANMDELRSELTDEQEVASLPPQPEPNRAPRPVIDPSDREVRVGGTVTFDGRASHDPDGHLVRFNWTVDGRPHASSPTAAVTFETPGAHRVALVVTDDDGRVATDSVDVTVLDDRPPSAEMQIADGKGRQVQRTTVGRQVIFDASASRDPEGADLAYAWDLGDGTRHRGEVVRSGYDRAGVYRVNLTVSDPGGATDRTSRVLTVDLQESREGTVALTEPNDRVVVPVRDGAREIAVTLTYTADVPLEDLDLVLDDPQGDSNAAGDPERVLPGDRTLSVSVPLPSPGEWTAHVALDHGVETEYTLTWTVTY